MRTPAHRRPGVVRPVPLRTVVCGPRWVAHDGDTTGPDCPPTSAAELLTRDPLGQKEWLDLLKLEPWVHHLRRDTRQRLLELVRCLAYCAGWETFETMPTWPALCAASGWARSTMASWLRQLRISGWLAVIEPGSTPQHRRKDSPDGVEGNRAAVYALQVPLTSEETRLLQQQPQSGIGHHEAVQDPESSFPQQHQCPPTQTSQTLAEHPHPLDENKDRKPDIPPSQTTTWTPSWSCFSSLETFVVTSTRARNFIHNPKTHSTPNNDKNTEALRARIDQEGLVFRFSDSAAVGRVEMLIAACELRAEHQVFARLSPRAVRSIARVYWAAGWSNQDLFHALDYRPVDSCTLAWSPPHGGIGNPAGWLRRRLRVWLDTQGQVLLSVTQRSAAREKTRARYGRVGERLLPRGEVRLLPEHVAEYGRQRAQVLAAQTAHRAERYAQRSAPRSREPEVASDCARAAIMATFHATETQRLARRRAALSAGVSSRHRGQLRLAWCGKPAQAYN